MSPDCGNLRLVNSPKPCRLRPPSYLHIVSAKRVGDLQALSASASCLEFGNDCKVVLRPRHGYVPKFTYRSYQTPDTLYCRRRVSDPVRVLRVYFECSTLFRQSEQLYVCFGGQSKGLSVMRLSHWIVDYIALT